MTNPIVRDVTERDAGAVARLCTQLGYPTRADELPDRIARITTDANARAIVAELPSQSAAVGMATIHLRYTLNHAAPLAQLTLLVVDESVRGTGVGRAIVAEAERWVRERGCRRMVVTTALRRSDAHAFYERVGYTHTGRRYAKDFD